MKGGVNESHFLDLPTLKVSPMNWPLSIRHSFCPPVIPFVGVVNFGLFSKMVLMIFPIFCVSAEDNRAHNLSQMAFLKIFLIPGYGGLSVHKRFFFYFFGLFSIATLRIFLISFMSVEGNMSHRLSQMGFLKEFLIMDYRGFSVQKRWVFLLFWPFFCNSFKDFPIFLHECRGQ